MEKINHRRLAKSGLLYFTVLFFLSFLDISYIYAVKIQGIAGNAEAYRTKGYEAQQRGDIDTAIEWYQKAANLRQDYASPHNDLGILFETKGWLDKAESEYQKALAIDQSYKEVHTNLALLYERKGELEKAAFHWMRRYKLGSPEDPWTQEAKERLEKLGLLDKAEKTVLKKETEPKVKEEVKKPEEKAKPARKKPARKKVEKKTRPEAKAKDDSEWTRIGAAKEKKPVKPLRSKPSSLDKELEESLSLAEERLRREQGGKKNAPAKKTETKKESRSESGSNAAYSRAKDHYNKGEYTKAMDEIRVAKQNDSENRSLSDLEDEVKFKMKEERIEDHHKEGLLSFRQRDFARARKEYEAILSIVPE